MFYSFDIFDTLITRKTAIPEGIFSIIQHKLQKDAKFADYPAYLIDDFYHIRCNAEIYARKYLTETEEITLTQIYHYIGKTYTLSDSQIQTLIQIECETEIENSVGISENISKVKEHIQNKDRVVLISDMYLPLNVIRKMLIASNPLFSDIKIYLSSEIGLTKITGNLFSYIQNIENVPYSSWIHIGDGKYSDYRIPKHLGIHVQQFQSEKLLTYEKELVTTYATSANIQRIIGISRCFRMEHKDKSSFLATIAIHLIYPYLQWIMESAHELKITDLYYLSRDGYVMKIIADIMNQYGLKHHYLYSSRDAWRIPTNFEDAAYTYDPYEYGIETISKLSSKIGIDDKDLISRLPTQLTTAKSISHAMIQEIFTHISKDTALASQVSKFWASKRDLLTQYINQEVKQITEKIAIVDTHSAGITVERLQNILMQSSPKKIRSYYLSPGDWGKEIKEHQDTQDVQYWYGSTDIGLILEALCRAPHGKCIGYEKKKDTILPILEGTFTDEYEPAPGYFLSLKKLTEEIVNSSETLTLIEGRHLFEKCSTYLLAKNTDRKILDAIGDIPFEYDNRLKKIVPFAPKFTLFSCISESLHILTHGHMIRTSHPVYSCKRGRWPVSAIGNFLAMILQSKNAEIINQISPVLLPKKIAKKIKIRSIL